MMTGTLLKHTLKTPISVAISSRNIVADFAAAVEEEVMLEVREDMREEIGTRIQITDFRRTPQTHKEK